MTQAESMVLGGLCLALLSGAWLELYVASIYSYLVLSAWMS